MHDMARWSNGRMEGSYLFDLRSNRNCAPTTAFWGIVL